MSSSVLLSSFFSCLRSPSRPSRYIERGYVPPCKRHVPLFPASSREGLPEPRTLHCLSADKRNSRLVASIWRTAGSNCMPCRRPPCCLHLNSGIARSSCRAFSPGYLHESRRVSMDVGQHVDFQAAFLFPVAFRVPAHAFHHVGKQRHRTRIKGIELLETDTLLRIPSAMSVLQEWVKISISLSGPPPMVYSLLQPAH